MKPRISWGSKGVELQEAFFEGALKFRKENNEFTRAILDGVFRVSVNQTSRIVDFVTKNSSKTLSLTTSFLIPFCDQNELNIQSQPVSERRASGAFSKRFRRIAA